MSLSVNKTEINLLNARSGEKANLQTQKGRSFGVPRDPGLNR